MDNRSLDQLTQFASFLEFLTNPEEAKQLLARLTEASKEYKIEVESIRGTKEFQLWRNGELAKLAEAQKALDAREAKLNTANAAKLAELDKKYEQIAVLAKEIDVAHSALNSKAADVEAKLAELQALKQEKEEFEEAKAVFAVRVDEFEKKKEAVEALLKG